MEKNSSSNFIKGDIVTYDKAYAEREKLEITQPDIQARYIQEINDDGTILLDGFFKAIPSKYVVPIPIDNELTQQLYYDNIYLGRVYEVGNVYDVGDISARQPLMTTINESMRDTPIWEAIQSGEFHFIHELQHWVEKNIAHDRIRINQFWQQHIED